ncbi:AcrR family transcriptional regulator [Microbacterium trichothecenolyticum]|uniref:TetR/AcrR family transcriptional regulator n=1 Tax=Microbacterium trichothecenolyticum TaxID=69370 RepID=UPI00285A7EAE|nr:TetR family transcriptional regulator [Microbacterium trichothecenolyticum]MDR7113586.1 AcrR family transcriptional regulator [Microbacterium trichothecenolyticum]
MTDTPVAEATGTSRRREATRQKLLDAAALVFAEVGLDAASVEAICERAGFTRGAFYSNFETKDELMLALTERVAGEKIDEVAERVAQLQERGEDLEPGALVRQLLDVAFDKKEGILLTSEIRTRAMRDQRLAETYLAWQAGIVQRLGSFIEELALTYRFRLRLPPQEFAGLILQTWEDTSAFAVMTGLSVPEMHQLVNERTARVATALVDPL